MTKKEIIELLGEEVGLFLKSEDENSLGELYIDEMRFREVEDLLKDLQKKIQRTKEYEKDLKNLIKKGGGFAVFRDMENGKLQNKEIHFDGHIILLDSPYFTFYNNTIYGTTND